VKDMDRHAKILRKKAKCVSIVILTKYKIHLKSFTHHAICGGPANNGELRVATVAEHREMQVVRGDGALGGGAQGEVRVVAVVSSLGFWGWWQRAPVTLPHIEAWGRRGNGGVASFVGGRQTAGGARGVEEERGGGGGGKPSGAR
jgi:hypothetical protein